MHFIRQGLLKTNQSVGLIDTQAIGKTNNNTVLFYLKVLRLNKLYVVNIACRGKSHVVIRHSYLFAVFRPSLVSNVESNVLDMTNIRFEIERELCKVAQRAGLGGNKQQRGQYFDKLGPLP